MYYAKQETDARMQMAAVAKNFFILSDILLLLMLFFTLYAWNEIKVNNEITNFVLY